MKVKLSTYEGVKYVEFKCPGCRDTHSLPVQTSQTKDGRRRASWKFNGDVNKPTLMPSIHSKVGPIDDPAYRVGDTGWDEKGMKGCHFWLKEGRIEFLNDCTHDLKNQTVELPEISTP